jgi:catechol 2,3-dioxygenase-like lactoylglutathione lyase family enzyme
MRLQHVSVAIPRDGAERARAFYGGVLGLEERAVLPKLDPGSFIWYALEGDGELHLMLSDERPPDKPHLCLVVDGELAAWRARIEAGGIETWDATELVGRPRFFCHDPFGNTLELTRWE